MTDTSSSVVITGVAGFLGRYIAQHFASQGWSVIGMDSVPPENAPLSSLAAYYCLKLPDIKFAEALRKHAPAVCIHCAGRASVPLSVSDPAADFNANTLLTFEVLDALRQHSPNCGFILLSSASVYGNPQSLPIDELQPVAPISPYGFHKLQAELICREFAEVYGLRTASVRIFSAYGPGLRRQVLWDVCRMALAGKGLKLQGSGNESRDFIHAHDVARALLLIAKKGTLTGEYYNLATGREVTIAELSRMVIRALNLSEQPEFSGSLPPGTPLNWQADISKLKSIGFAPSVSLEDGVGTYAGWCRAELADI